MTAPDRDEDFYNAGIVARLFADPPEPPECFDDFEAASWLAGWQDGEPAENWGAAPNPSPQADAETPDNQN